MGSGQTVRRVEPSPVPFGSRKPSHRCHSWRDGQPYGVEEACSTHRDSSAPARSYPRWGLNQGLVILCSLPLSHRFAHQSLARVPLWEGMVVGQFVLGSALAPNLKDATLLLDDFSITRALDMAAPPAPPPPPPVRGALLSIGFEGDFVEDDVVLHTKGDGAGALVFVPQSTGAAFGAGHGLFTAVTQPYRQACDAQLHLNRPFTPVSTSSTTTSPPPISKPSAAKSAALGYTFSFHARAGCRPLADVNPRASPPPPSRFYMSEGGGVETNRGPPSPPLVMPLVPVVPASLLPLELLPLL